MKSIILLFALLLGSINIAFGQSVETTHNNPNKLSFLTVSNFSSDAPDMFANSAVAADLQPSAESLEILNNITFGVIVGVFTYPVPIQSEFCRQIRDDLIVTQSNDGYVYSVGAFKNYAEADKLLENLKKMGYSNAGVLAFIKIHLS